MEDLVEGTFGRMFRSEVRPIELARKLVREMDAHTTTSVTRLYAPHEYDIWLSSQDRDHYDGIEEEVIDELCAYLLEHARREQLTLAGRPIITFHTDRELQLGEFGIQTHPLRLQDDEDHLLADRDHIDDRRSRAAERGPDDHLGAQELADLHHRFPAEPGVGGTMLYSGARRLREPLQQAPVRGGRQASLLVDGRRLPLPAAGGVIGRSRDCDIVLADSGVSRRHAEIRPEGEGWVLRDLGSTNGVRVGSRRVEGSGRPLPLRSGEVLVLGSTEVVFELL